MVALVEPLEVVVDPLANQEEQEILHQLLQHKEEMEEQVEIHLQMLRDLVRLVFASGATSIDIQFLERNHVRAALRKMSHLAAGLVGGTSIRQLVVIPECAVDQNAICSGGFLDDALRPITQPGCIEAATPTRFVHEDHADRVVFGRPMSSRRVGRCLTREGHWMQGDARNLRDLDGHFPDRVDRPWAPIERHWVDQFSKASPDEHFAVVSHGLFLRVLIERILLSPEQLETHGNENGEIVIANTALTVVAPGAPGEATSEHRVELIACIAHLDGDTAHDSNSIVGI